ncbi:iron-containing alcohol dehydrogenase family protein [Nocardioides pelophilus]|uniref:iron-containing alcohol dehydrogenase family protein n=1 Tax=Nocardioides pelophilus TaxID=2172019 RepID=UPI0016024F84|nr:iron-containing alcohol dehydrogenase family protein [Nocardioides pelophilus]
MPLLARMLASPLHLDIRAGAVDNLAALLHERAITSGGTVMVAVGSGQGAEIWERVRPSMPNATVFQVEEGSLSSAGDLQEALGRQGYDAVVGIGGGKTIDVAKYAATRAALPMVAVATNLAHDGICSPVASLEHPHGKGSYGVALPLAVVVDLDYVRTAPPAMVLGGIGDAISNLSAIEDWLLARRERGEAVDGLALAFARTAGEAILHRPDSIGDDDFLIALAEALVLSGMAMSVAGTSRPCSGACHEIIHAIDKLYPGVSNHGELAGIGALFATFLRGDDARFDQIAACLDRHGLAVSPVQIGLTEEQFVAAVLAAPSTRPDRYTILEHLELDEEAVREWVAGFVSRLPRTAPKPPAL